MQAYGRPALWPSDHINKFRGTSESEVQMACYKRYWIPQAKDNLSISSNCVALRQWLPTIALGTTSDPPPPKKKLSYDRKLYYCLNWKNLHAKKIKVNLSDGHTTF